MDWLARPVGRVAQPAQTDRKPWLRAHRAEDAALPIEALYPKLSQRGCLIIDDDGDWAGSKKTTDEYFEQHGNRPFLQYTDDTGRVGVKLA